MERWIRDLISSVTSGLTNLINAAVDRILWVYNVFIAFFIKVRGAFDYALNGIRSKLSALLNAANEIYVTLRWIVFVRIPQIVGTAVRDAVTYVLQQVESVRNYLVGIANNIITWAVNQVQRIDAFIDSVIRWATAHINAIVDTLTRVRDIVYMLLSDPRRLAAWAIDAIVGEFVRWLDRNADRIAIAIRQRSIAYTLMFADRIEDMITRLL